MLEKARGVGLGLAAPFGWVVDVDPRTLACNFGGFGFLVIRCLFFLVYPMHRGGAAGLRLVYSRHLLLFAFAALWNGRGRGVHFLGIPVISMILQVHTGESFEVAHPPGCPMSLVIPVISMILQIHAGESFEVVHPPAWVLFCF